MSIKAESKLTTFQEERISTWKGIPGDRAETQEGRVSTGHWVNTVPYIHVCEIVSLFVMLETSETTENSVAVKRGKSAALVRSPCGLSRH